MSFTLVSSGVKSGNGGAQPGKVNSQRLGAELRRASAESDLRSGSFCVIDERGNDNTPEHVSDDVPLLSFSGDNGRGDDRGVPERYPAATNFLTMVADDVKLNGGGRHSGKINFQKCSDPLLAATET
nr:hypothetical protein Itr_chr07CG09070 [Ipomoea trifida]